MLEELKAEVCRANRDLVTNGLVTLTWGNVSGIDHEQNLVAIKPSGVPYEALTPRQIVIVDLDGKVVEGELNPSSDTPTHVYLYRHLLDTPALTGEAGDKPGEPSGGGGITHTHSPWATVFAQARMPIPCLGTTHADHFHGPVPVTRPLTESEIDQGYEHHTGRAIVELFTEQHIDPAAVPGVLLAGHAPFTWGKNASDSLNNAIALEAIAQMAHATVALKADADELEDYILNKHHTRKHGPDAYYGQKT